ncbi:MAG: cation transporter [Dehalococcoidia bacterium]|nr:cation transporter [Dehalococcoidia bacterium]
MALGKTSYTVEPSDEVCAEDCCADKANELAQLATRTAQRRVLLIVLAINATMFVAEMGAGIIARSTSLMADSVDMFGDATVYVLSLYALGRGVRWRAGAALAKSAIIFAFGLWILAEVGRRLVVGGAPDAGTIGAVGILALAANLTCLGLLWRFRAHDINMSSTFECSRNDVIANVGVLVAAAGVGVTGDAWPDLAVGVLIAIVFLRSAFLIGRAALPEFALAKGRTAPA